MPAVAFKKTTRGVARRPLVINAKRKPLLSSTKIDPSGTSSIRRKFQTEMTKRFALLKKTLLDMVVKEDALGLVQNMNPNHDELGRFASGSGQKRLESISHKLAAAAQEEYDAWDETQEGFEDEYAGGGICHLIAENIQGVLSDHGIDSQSVDSQGVGDQHVWVVAKMHDGIYDIDIPPHIYESGSGYSWKKKHGVRFSRDHIYIDKIDDDPERWDDYTSNSRWRFQTSLQKLESFRKWLRTQLQSIILMPEEKEGAEAWWQNYVEQGYRQGAQRSFDDVHRDSPRFDQIHSNEPMPGYKGSVRDWMRSSFGRVVPTEKLKLLAGRVFSDLDGITDYMETGITRALTDGLTRGQHPKQIANEMSKTVDISLDRAKTLSRTEIIRAHAEGQLDALERMGIEEVGVLVEWSTAGDNHVCSLCKPLDGVVMTIQQARGLIPRHPNCRCAFVPASYLAELNQTKVQAALSKSLGMERGKTKRSLAKQKRLSKWVGAELVKNALRVNMNPYHARDGRFTFAADEGVGGGGHSIEHQRLKTWSEKNLPTFLKAHKSAKKYYKTLEDEHGSRWAKAIAASAILSIPIPIPGASVATTAAMVGLARLWKFFNEEEKDKE